jgi:hypothetical protein
LRQNVAARRRALQPACGFASLDDGDRLIFCGVPREEYRHDDCTHISSRAISRCAPAPRGAQLMARVDAKSMAIDHLGKDLQALGISGRDLRCLLFLPQIYVGWTSPQRDLPYLEALLETTARRTGFGPECLALARGWLFEKPTLAQFQSGCAMLRVLRRVTPEPLIGSSDVLEAMLWAVRASAPPGETPAASAEELQRSPAGRALHDLEAWLEVDTSHLWLDILADMDERGSPASRPLSALVEDPTRGRQGDEPSNPDQTSVPPPLDGAADDEHSALLLIREPARLRAQPFPLERRIG